MFFDFLRLTSFFFYFVYFIFIFIFFFFLFLENRKKIEMTEVSRVRSDSLAVSGGGPKVLVIHAGGKLLLIIIIFHFTLKFPI